MQLFTESGPNAMLILSYLFAPGMSSVMALKIYIFFSLFIQSIAQEMLNAVGNNFVSGANVRKLFQRERMAQFVKISRIAILECAVLFRKVKQFYFSYNARASMLSFSAKPRWLIKGELYVGL